MRRAAAAALVLLAAGWALTLWVPPWNDESVNDLFVYRSFAAPVLDGGLPYRDVAFEYPPLAVPAIALPGLAGTGEDAFRWAFALWMLAAAAAVVLLCGALARAGVAQPDRTPGASARAMLAVAATPLLCGALLRTHFDLFPVALLLAGLLLLCRERPRAGLAVLGVGAMTKVFPLVAVPVALAWLLARGRRRDAWQGALACAAVMAVITGTALVTSPDGALDAVRYHLDRPVQVESSPALVLLGLDAIGAGEARSVSAFRSDGLLHPASDVVTSLFLTALVALVALLCALAAGEGRGVSRRGACDCAPLASDAHATRPRPTRPSGRWSLPASPLVRVSPCSARCSRRSSSSGCCRSGRSRSPGECTHLRPAWRSWPS